MRKKYRVLVEACALLETTVDAGSEQDAKEMTTSWAARELGPVGDIFKLDVSVVSVEAE